MLLPAFQDPVFLSHDAFRVQIPPFDFGMISLRFLAALLVAISLNLARARAESPEWEVEDPHQHEARGIQPARDYDKGEFRFDEPIYTGLDCGWQATRRLKRGSKGGDSHCKTLHDFVTKNGIMFDVSYICDRPYAAWGGLDDKMAIRFDLKGIDSEKLKEQRAKGGLVRVVHEYAPFQFFNVEMIIEGVGGEQIGWRGFRCVSADLGSARRTGPANVRMSVWVD